MQALRPRFSLRWKLLIVSFLLMAVPTLMLGTIVFRTSTTETDAMLEDSLKNNVRLVVETIGLLDTQAKSGLLPLEQAQSQLKDMLLGAYRTDGTRPINKNIDLGANGYFFVLADDGTAVAHPKREGQSLWEERSSDGFFFIQDLIAKAQNGGGFTEYAWPLPGEGVTEEAMKITYAEKDPYWGWIVSAGSYIQDFNEGQQRIEKAIAVTVAVALVVGLVATVAFAYYVTSPISLVSARLRRIAQGELNAPPLRVKRRDESGLLAEDTNTMAAHLRTLVSEVSSGAASVLDASHQLAASAGQSAQATRGVTQSIANIAHGVDSQSAAAAQSARAMEEMTSGIQRIAETSAVAYDSSVQATSSASSGVEAVERAVRQIEQAVGAVRELSSTIHGLERRSEEIATILELISDIARQTNLLSLNASIEAARAGEHGRGFGVVAGEIKKLAEQSDRSTDDIRQVIEKIRGDIQYCVASMTASEREVQESAELVVRTGEAFRTIDAAARRALGQVEETTAASEQMSAGSEEIAASIQEIADISSKSAAATQEISTASQEQLAVMESMEQSARSLAELARQLKDASSRFRL
ncbi:HAMP domain-containing protein [Paenibacillus antri]|uniref:HAMP domain-containing protein n=1 Tax=Paenibacillus antri TaxID=2582848 RepID=A0A5R9GAX8_9BACL|nr:methyl-accepting chemotaxis protein [Paenibacillus antri]TLS52881.1 HAMP domain-containing protein [Paenibacillus antri]